ncbi:DUF2271 domain-containing protein [Brumicola nitratireducens]|uniref:Tat (Twin-arginine translocation) pathway signal sequence domain protein n=1 Tax=Glaciecola nitratireducens (strain JCM 12485 / KCTC 12276 / FR1064) TaxID=1085623 RepID=G4QMX0_GLANF|nr:DUF2271 domain-containing protein [Glaciecola nitratireducens]AEP31053.1 hypothetical protein GNIT_2956 [Glaciecola nitratireducens FR1064]
MKKLLLRTGLVAAVMLPFFTQAKDVTFTTTLSDYRGDGAYLAIYLTDSAGVYQKTFWVSGKKSKHFKHLRDWAQGSAMRRSEYDGMTGASVSRGQTLQITVDLDPSFIDSGYQVRVDSAVEDMGDKPADIIAPLTTKGAATPINGEGYVYSFTYVF